MLLGGSDKRQSLDEVQGNPGVPAAITDTGCERELNEDRYAVIECPSGLAWFVCDGMGGAMGGELAAQLAIDALRRDLEGFPKRQPGSALRSAILEANRVILLRRQNKAFQGMGTTLTSVMFSGSEVVLGHVGDSRAYLVRDGAIQQLTKDHTYVQQLVDAGQIRPEEALSHPQAHILTKCIGAEPGLDLDTDSFWIWDVGPEEPVDHLVLCSDGLYSLVTDGEIASYVSQQAPQQACAKLVELAKKRGGYDNITLAILPLEGQLKQEPPIGYEDSVARELRKANREPSVLEQMSTGKIMMIIFVLTALAVLATIAVFAFSIKLGG